MMIAQSWMVLPLSFAAVLCAASGEPANPYSAAAAASSTAPTNFDFLVLASIADSPQPISMASYSPAGRR
jgi:hypothetical protein